MRKRCKTSLAAMASMSALIGSLAVTPSAFGQTSAVQDSNTIQLPAYVPGKTGAVFVLGGIESAAEFKQPASPEALAPGVLTNVAAPQNEVVPDPVTDEEPKKVTASAIFVGSPDEDEPKQDNTQDSKIEHKVEFKWVGNDQQGKPQAIFVPQGEDAEHLIELIAEANGDEHKAKIVKVLQAHGHNIVVPKGAIAGNAVYAYVLGEGDKPGEKTMTLRLRRSNEGDEQAKGEPKVIERRIKLGDHAISDEGIHGLIIKALKDVGSDKRVEVHVDARQAGDDAEGSEKKVTERRIVLHGDGVLSGDGIHGTILNLGDDDKEAGQKRIQIRIGKDDGVSKTESRRIIIRRNEETDDGHDHAHGDHGHSHDDHEHHEHGDHEQHGAHGHGDSGHGDDDEHAEEKKIEVRVEVEKAQGSGRGSARGGPQRGRNDQPARGQGRGAGRGGPTRGDSARGDGQRGDGARGDGERGDSARGDGARGGDRPSRDDQAERRGPDAERRETLRSMMEKRGETQREAMQQRQQQMSQMMRQMRGAQGRGGPSDRGPGDRGPSDRGPSDRGPGDRGPSDRGPGDRGPSDRGPSDRGPGDRGPSDRGPSDRGPSDRGPSDRGPSDRGPSDRGPSDRGPGGYRGPGGDRGPGDRGPGDRGPGDRGPGDRVERGGPRPNNWVPSRRGPDGQPSTGGPRSGGPGMGRPGPGVGGPGVSGAGPAAGGPRGAAGIGGPRFGGSGIGANRPGRPQNDRPQDNRATGGPVYDGQPRKSATNIVHEIQVLDEVLESASVQRLLGLMEENAELKAALEIMKSEAGAKMEIAELRNHVLEQEADRRIEEAEQQLEELEDHKRHLHEQFEEVEERMHEAEEMREHAERQMHEAREMAERAEHAPRRNAEAMKAFEQRHAEMAKRLDEVTKENHKLRELIEVGQKMGKAAESKSEQALARAMQELEHSMRGKAELEHRARLLESQNQELAKKLKTVLTQLAEQKNSAAGKKTESNRRDSELAKRRELQQKQLAEKRRAEELKRADELKRAAAKKQAEEKKHAESKKRAEQRSKESKQKESKKKKQDDG